MSRRKCPVCGERILPATHLPTPELKGSGDAWVGWCVIAQKHAVIPVGWAEDVRRSLRRLGVRPTNEQGRPPRREA